MYIDTEQAEAELKVSTDHMNTHCNTFDITMLTRVCAAPVHKDLVWGV